MEEAFNTLRPILHGVTDYEVDEQELPWSQFPHLIEKIYSPPSYLAYLALSTVGQFKDYGRSEKVDWRFFVRYRSFAFEIYDWKRSSWSIRSLDNNDLALKAAADLKRKISQVAARLDDVLQPDMRRMLESERFYLHNGYPKLRLVYQHYRDLFKKNPPTEEESSYDSTQSRSQKIERFNEMVRRESERAMYGYAMVGLYFSALDLFETICFALGNRSCRFGLVPLSYEALTRSVHFTSTFEDVEFAGKALSAFETFDKWLAGNEPYACYLAFAKSGLAVPFYGSQLQSIRDAMHDVETFRQWIDEYWYAIDMAAEAW